MNKKDEDIKFDRPNNDSTGLLAMLIKKILTESRMINTLEDKLIQAAQKKEGNKTNKSINTFKTNWLSKITAGSVSFKTIAAMLNEVFEVISIEFTIKIKWSKDYETAHTMTGTFRQSPGSNAKDEENKDGSKTSTDK